jgi:hypothetical protein
MFLKHTGVNFINILSTAFALVDPKSVRTQSNCQYLFTLLGSMSVKTVSKYVDEIDPRWASLFEVNFDF